MATAASMMGNGAPVRSGLPRKPGVCRCLFGRPTAAEQAESLANARSLNELYVEEKSRVYGFDFGRGTPISGDRRGMWEMVEPRSSNVTTDSVASSPPVESSPAPEEDRVLSPPSETVPVVDVSIAEIPASVSTPAEPIVNVDIPSSSAESRCRKRNGAKAAITDFFQVKKPRSGSPQMTLKDVVSGSASSSSDTHTVDQVN